MKRVIAIAAWAALSAAAANASQEPVSAGDKLQAEGRFEEALSAYRKETAGAKGEARGRLLIRQALVQEALGKPDTARELLAQARKDAFAPAAVEEARLVMENQPFDTAAAVALLKDAAKHAGSDASVRVALGNALVNAGKFDEAGKEFELVIGKLEPKSIPARWGKARMLLRQGRSKEAIETLMEANQLAPSDAETMARIGSAWLASAEPDRLARARSWYEQASRARPGDARYLQWLVLGYLLEDRAGDAVETIGYLREKFPTASATLWAGAALDEVKARIGEAVDGYKRAAAADGKNLLAHYALGQALSGRGNREWAKAGMTSGAYANYHDPDLAARYLSYVLAVPGDLPFANAALATLEMLRKRQKTEAWRSLPSQVLQDFYNYGKALDDHY